MAILYNHVNARGRSGLLGTDLMPCVDSIGNIRSVQYLGGLKFAIDTDGDYVCGWIAEEGSGYDQAGFLRIVLPNIDYIEPLHFSVQVFAAMLRTGLAVCDRTGCHYHPEKARKKALLPVPTVNQAWHDIGGRFQIGMDDKTFNRLTSTVVHVDDNGYFLYDPDAKFQSMKFIRAEDRFAMQLLRESRPVMGMVKVNRIEALINTHLNYCDKRQRCHESLARWMCQP